MKSINITNYHYTYKDYVIDRVVQMPNPMSLFDDVFCRVRKPGYIERQRDDRGRTIRTLYHEDDIFTFTLDGTEFCDNDSPEIVLYNRFVAEVDYHIKQDNSDLIQAEAVIQAEPSMFIRRYFCRHCGTDFFSTKEGYTPKCENCGSLMQLGEN